MCTSFHNTRYMIPIPRTISPVSLHSGGAADSQSVEHLVVKHPYLCLPDVPYKQQKTRQNFSSIYLPRIIELNLSVSTYPIRLDISCCR